MKKRVVQIGKLEIGFTKRTWARPRPHTWSKHFPSGKKTRWFTAGPFVLWAKRS